MNKSEKQTLAYLIPFLFLVSCEQKTDWELQPSGIFPVADCIITNEMKQHELWLYRSASQLNQPTEGYSGVTVELSDGSQSVTFTEDPDKQGHYISVLPFMASSGKTYRLALSYNDLADTAYASMTGVSPLESIDIAPADGYFHLVFHPGTPAFMMDVHYDWSADTLFCKQYGACEAAEVYYSLDNIDVGKLFAPEKEVILFPHKTQIIRRKYSLTEEHQQFLRSLLLETEWRGGLFDVEQGNVPTNFHYGVRGWFAACAVVTDTVVFE